MPEGEAKEAKGEVKAKAKDASPRRRPAGNQAQVKVELLDGSTMELQVDVSIVKTSIQIELIMMCNAMTKNVYIFIQFMWKYTWRLTDLRKLYWLILYYLLVTISHLFIRSYITSLLGTLI